MADMHTPLKPCPFCSGAADHDNGSRIVECSACHGGFYEDTEADAITAWNRRAPSQDAEKIKALREALVRLIYETTHLSPIESDGSHHCYISSDALSAARAALAGSAS